MLLFDLFLLARSFFPLFLPVIFVGKQFGWIVENIFVSAMIHRLSIDDALLSIEMYQTAITEKSQFCR